MVLFKLFRPKRQNVTPGWRKRHSERNFIMYKHSLPNIMTVIIQKMVGIVRNVPRWGKKVH